MKKCIAALFLLGFLQVFSQEKNDLYVKGNAVLLPIGVLNAGLEYQLSQRYTLQGDVFISPWKSFLGHELQYYSISAEGRYYFDKAFKSWYIGANVSTAVFNLQKWNYWVEGTIINENNEEFKISNLYQKGFSVLIGATVGYQFKLAERWNMDIYATAGSSQDFYKAYDRTTGQRSDVAMGRNKSGEFLPYRGGVMISYKLR